jgi:hypothetical protein
MIKAVPSIRAQTMTAAFTGSDRFIRCRRRPADV